MKERGFISLELDAILIAVAAVGIVSGVLYLMHVGAANERAKQEAANKEAQIERQKLVTGLALDLANTKTDLAQARNDKARLLEEKEATHASLLHDYVPKRALGKSCISNGFVRYADAAAAGVSLDPRPEPVVTQASSSVGDDDAAAVIARNYWKYHACEQRVSDILQEFDAIRTKYNAVVNQINDKVQQR